ncbi:hypothetical protein H5410_022120 [Solanum commersonii]|uniref:Uncharacterized protein n=1 Tax=Solanum commersonii TaxID=4109 RepID=A0A9J5ZFV1_SOLCO|nr:hypothetical protein H5410_022120 [Solanum commersonii]
MDSNSSGGRTTKEHPGRQFRRPTRTPNNRSGRLQPAGTRPALRPAPATTDNPRRQQLPDDNNNEPMSFASLLLSSGKT